MKKQLLAAMAALLFFASCKKDDPFAIPAPEFTVPDEFYTTEEYVTIQDVSQADAYKWDFGNGTTSTHRMPDSFRYTKPGSYTVRLTTYTDGQASTVEKVVKVAQLYAYEVQLLSYIENYALEGGDTGAPSEGNPDVYLQVSTYANNAEQVLYKSDVRRGVTREDLPLTFAVDRILLGGDEPSTFSPFFKFFDQNEDKADRLIAHNIVAGGSTKFHLDKESREGYYTQQRGNDDWGSHILVKFRAELP
ncbi:PKD domain-containing protein [Pontibacter roseus]|uniref:PKD domain-containing protein n=1 Tax=Pontibacter roseus TaxID=336989 RepID=UPI00036AD403|nr:PKD domain-containing protein [Pontibacter roseus]